jgi:two-component system, NtrC family, response regulator AtoC
MIAATNQDLEKLVNEKKFREDLYYRLNVFPIQIPPLRERPEDIGALANYFLQSFNRKFGKNVLGFSKEATHSLIAYGWPGNVRELRNVIERAMILQVAPYIEPAQLHLRKEEPSSNGQFQSIIPLAEAEKALIQRALTSTRGNVVQAAKLLRISRDKLRYKIKKHQLLEPHSNQFE